MEISDEVMKGLVKVVEALDADIRTKWGAELLKIVEQWRDEHMICCADAIYQVDAVKESLPALAEKLLEVVGEYDEAQEL